MPLRIFEPRYLDMVKDCVRENSTFVVCLIRAGSEAGPAASFHTVGTECKIIDWHTTPEGLLGISVIGVHRGTVSDPSVRPDQLITASFERIEEMADEPLPAAFNDWAQLLEKIIDKLGSPFSDQMADYQSADWVGARLIEYLPLELEKKQRLLVIDHPLVRLEHLKDSLQDLEFYQRAGGFSA